MSATSWDLQLYRMFDDHRSRPFLDLVSRIGMPDPALPRVVDAGCGPGHLTDLLAQYWPAATIEAFDSSPEMVAAARDGGVPAARVDVRDWTPPRDTGVIVTNAVLQWVPEHPDVLRRWIASLAPARGSRCRCPPTSTHPRTCSPARWPRSLAGGTGS